MCLPHPPPPFAIELPVICHSLVFLSSLAADGGKICARSLKLPPFLCRSHKNTRSAPERPSAASMPSATDEGRRRLCLPPCSALLNLRVAAFPDHRDRRRTEREQAPHRGNVSALLPSPWAFPAAGCFFIIERLHFANFLQTVPSPVSLELFRCCPRAAPADEISPCRRVQPAAPGL